MKHITIIILTLMVSAPIYGQNAGDALRYSYWQYGGSARYVATGGSMGALGGDYSSVISNPASLASFRRSELTITPGVLISGTDATFEGATFSRSRTSGNFSEAAIVFASTRPDKWKTVNFSIGYSKLADFSQKFNYTGESEGSIANYFLELSQGLDPSQLSDFDNGLAYDTELIYETSTPTLYENDFFPGDRTSKFQSVNQSGSMGELNLAVGGNMNHKLYLGASIGVPIVSFSSEKTYQETDVDGTVNFFNGLSYTENLNTSGVGVNLNVGAIYRVNQALRIGAAFHSPTWITLTDTYSNSLDFDITYNEGETNEIRQTNSATSPVGTYEYKQTTPLRLIGNVGVVIKKIGFVSAEVEYLDYTENSYNFSSNASSPDDLFIENEVNGTIRSIFQSTLNIRTGAEFVIEKDFRLRAGYGLLGNPYANNDGIFQGSQFSLGAGYRQKNYFVDIAYLRRTNSQFYEPYGLASSSPVVENDLSQDYILLTLGFKFGR